MDLVFLLHTSTQISDMAFKLIINFLKNVLRDVDVDSGDVRVGIAMYRRDSDILFNLDQYNSKRELIKAIESIPDDYRSDEANLARGLRVVRQIMLSEAKDKRPSVPNAVVIITDGLSTAGSNDLKSAVLMLKDVAYIFAIGIGIHTSAELNNVVSEPANINHFLVVSIEHLGDVEPQLTEQMMACEYTASKKDGSMHAQMHAVAITTAATAAAAKAAAAGFASVPFWFRQKQRRFDKILYYLVIGKKALSLDHHHEILGNYFKKENIFLMRFFFS